MISTKDARYGAMDIKDFFLTAWLTDFQYMKLPIDIIPNKFIALYKLQDKIIDGFICIEIRRGMYGLPMAGKLAYDNLVTHLLPYGYKPCTFIPGLWIHSTRKISFTLVVDVLELNISIKKTSITLLMLYPKNIKLKLM